MGFEISNVTESLFFDCVRAGAFSRSDHSPSSFWVTRCRISSSSCSEITTRDASNSSNDERYGAKQTLADLLVCLAERRRRSRLVLTRGRSAQRRGCSRLGACLGFVVRGGEWRGDEHWLREACERSDQSHHRTGRNQTGNAVAATSDDVSDRHRVDRLHLECY